MQDTIFKSMYFEFFLPANGWFRREGNIILGVNSVNLSYSKTQGVIIYGRGYFRNISKLLAERMLKMSDHWIFGQAFNSE